MTVREVLEQAREAALQIRKIEEEAELRRQRIGPQGYSMGVHAKNSILDPMRKVDDLIAWETERRQDPELSGPIDYAYQLVSGIEKLADTTTLEAITRYYLQGDELPFIIRDLEQRHGFMRGADYAKQEAALTTAMDKGLSEWESIGIAHLREMGR